MRPYRFRAVFLLFLVLNLTACQSWQSISLEDSIRLVELSEEDRVRVNCGGIVKGEVVEPSVEGDQLVGAGDFSMPLEDITDRVPSDQRGAHYTARATCLAILYSSIHPIFDRRWGISVLVKVRRGPKETLPPPRCSTALPSVLLIRAGADGSQIII